MAKISRLTSVVRDENTVLTVGTFDGVHIGHRLLVETVVERARQRNARSVIVTFDPHPRDIISPGTEGISLLTSLDERLAILGGIGIDEMIVIPFDRDFSLLSSEEFIRDIIWGKIGVDEFIIGYDHHFGKDRSGTIETIRRLSKELQFDVKVISKQESGNRKVSSTLIRDIIENGGDVVKAAKLLGQPYMLHGFVIQGEKRGRLTGYPTANIEPGHPNKSIPKNGVYAVRITVSGSTRSGMMNIGIRPTFGGGERSLEVHIFDFDSDIYGREIEVQFVKRIRDERKFDSIEQLKLQLEKDKSTAEAVLKNS